MVLDTFRLFIQRLSKKAFKRFAFIYIVICIAIVMGIIIRHLSLVNQSKEKIIQLNKARKSIQEILTEFGQVEQQKNKIDAILKKDKFRIQKFFQDIAQKYKVHFTEKSSTKSMENGYTEESLYVTISQITTKQLCDLLEDIEKEQRVFIKFVDIAKMGTAKKINVTMDLATFIPKSD